MLFGIIWGAVLVDKRQVIKKARHYMNHIRNIPDQINDIRQEIDDLETALKLLPAASTSKLDKSTGKIPYYSTTSEAVQKSDNIRERIAAHYKRIERLEKEREKVKAAISDLFYISRGDWGDVLTKKYIDNMPMSAIAKYKHKSKSTLGTMENNGLLSLANTLLNLPADGESYDYKGRYIPMTAKQKYDIEHWEKTTDIPRVLE